MVVVVVAAADGERGGLRQTNMNGLRVGEGENEAMENLICQLFATTCMPIATTMMIMMISEPPGLEIARRVQTLSLTITTVTTTSPSSPFSLGDWTSPLGTGTSSWRAGIATATVCMCEASEVLQPQAERYDDSSPLPPPPPPLSSSER